MRPVRWLLAATAALALGIETRGHATDSAFLPVLNDLAEATTQSVLLASDSELPLLDDFVDADASAPPDDKSSERVVLLASDGGLPLLDTLVDAGANATNDGESAENVVLLALSAVSSQIAKCNRGGPKLDVLFGISVCFSDGEITTLLSTINQAIVTASSNKFYFQNGFIDRSFLYGGYKDGTCQSTGRPKPDVIFDNLKPADTFQRQYDLYVNIGKDTGVSFTPLLKSLEFNNIRSTLETRVCASAATCKADDVVVADVASYDQAAPAVTSGMYCDDLTGANPYTYTGDNNKLQCGCQCPGGKVPTSGKCKCPGELEPDATGLCGCSGGRTKTPDNKCICMGGSEYSTTSKTCECPSGSTRTNGVCVKNCYWKASNEGFSCLWKDQTKTSLKLKTDCSVSAPVAKDNYVADKRTNKFDPANPETYGSPSANPKISVTATKKNTPTETQTKATTWLNYMLSPGDLEDKVQLGSFGVFDLSMTASDYRYEATCPGCVAVVDDYPPTPKVLCGTTDTRSTTNLDYSTTTLGTVIADETKFTNFYGSDNVLNNGDETAAGDNKRCDVESMEVTDFFKTTATTSSSVSSKCFTDSLISELLTSAKDASLSPLSSLVQSTPMGALACQRCCFKSIVLKEHYAKYECGITSPVWDKQGESNCKYGRCVTVQPKDLITASAKTTDASNTKTSTTLGGLPTGSETRTDAKYIHRSVTCTKWSENCKVEPKLGDIISTKAEWKAAVTGFNVDEFVFWRYKVGSSGTWTAWDGEAKLTFTDESTTIGVEAYSRCGKLLDTSFEFVLHLHTDRIPCKSFTDRFVDNAPVPTKVDSNICAYPKSDFALLTFNYDSSENVPHDAGKVKGKYTDISCTVTVAEAGNAPTTAPLTMSLPAADATGLIKFGKQFALELVKDPTTAMNTDVKFICTIKFKYFDDDKVDTDTCTADFRLTDCNGPKLQTYSTDAVCLPGKCGSPTGPPGLFETCAGEVFTTAKSGSVVSTTSRTTSSPCCTQCSTTLTCSALTSATDAVKRCEPPANYEMLLALAMDKTETQTLAHYVQPSSSVVTMLLSASAMVAVVAVVAAKAGRRGHAQAQPVVADDVYMSLMD